jgi:rRNA-processing protein FCF1
MSSEMNVAIDKLSRSDQFMVTRCVVRELAGLCTTELQGTTGCYGKLMKIAGGE